MVNPAECRVCFTTFSTEEDHRPRTFPCGHTCCSACIVTLLQVEEGHCLTCPACRVKHPAQDAAAFPINYGMEALIEQMKGLGQVSEEEEEEESQDGNVQDEALKDWMMNLLLECSELKMQLVQHQDKLQRPQTLHMHLLNQLCDFVDDNKNAMTQLIETQAKYRQLMDQGQDIMANLQAVMEQTMEKLTRGRRTALANLAQCRVQEMDRWKLKYKEMKRSDRSLGTSAQVLVATQEGLKRLTAETFDEGKDVAASSTDASSSSYSSSPSSSQLSVLLNRAQHCLDYLPSRPSTLTTDDLRILNAEVRRLLEARLVFAMHQEGNVVRCSSLTLEHGDLHLYHLSCAPPPYHAHTVTIPGYLSAPHPSCLVFLDLAWRGETHGRLYIRLHLVTPLARQFLLLCSGREGHTYAGTFLLKVCGLHNQGEFVMGGDYATNDGTGGAALLGDLRGDYIQTGAAGSVWGRWDFEDPRAAQFAITTRQCRGTIPRVFGTVEEGMGVMKAAVAVLRNERVVVQECGVVVHL